jgi:Zn ribbon nucleic-acid-binding protein
MDKRRGYECSGVGKGLIGLRVIEMARFGKCPNCHQLALLAVVRRDLLGDLVAFLKCVNCDYEDKKKVAGLTDLYGGFKDLEKRGDSLGLYEDDDD